MTGNNQIVAFILLHIALFSQSQPGTANSSSTDDFQYTTQAADVSPSYTYVDRCQSSPCINGGYCSKDASDYTCHCSPGYRGRQCQEDTNECDSSPCQNGGTCRDLIDDYQCACTVGFTGKNCETNVDECQNNPCFNNNSCVDGIGRHQCICPNSTVWVGLYCNISRLSIPESSHPTFLRVSPNYGPVSGLTNITITGQNLQMFGGVFAINIGPTKLFVTYGTSSNVEIGAVTKPVDKSIIGQPLPLVFEVMGGAKVQSSLTFTYHDDPTIQDIQPRTYLRTGGQLLTVTGSNLNASASPILTVSVAYTRPDFQNKNVSIATSPICTVVSSAEVVCLTPAIDAVGDTGEAYDQNVGRRQRPGRRRQEEGPSSPEVKDVSYSIYVGLRFDGFRRYDNLSREFPNKTIDFHNPPLVYEEVEIRKFYTRGETTLTINGRGLTRGCRMSDYKVLIGTGDCSVYSLTDNEILCRPPKHEPQENQSLSFCTDDNAATVMIYVGYMEEFWGCLKYQEQLLWWESLLIALAVTACGLIILVVVLVIIRRRRQQKARISHSHIEFP